MKVMIEASHDRYRTTVCISTLRQWLFLTGNICSGSPPKVFEIDMAQGQDMSKGPGTEEIMFIPAFIPEI